MWGLILPFLTSCSELSKELGGGPSSAMDQKQGITGTFQNPAVMDPFKKYDLVMAGDECRFLIMKVPSQWYWKFFLTAANRNENQKGHLSAEIAKVEPPWASLPGTLLKKDFDLNHGEGDQTVLAVGNTGPDRFALLKLCQNGAPLVVTLQSEVSATGALLSPQTEGVALTPTPDP